MFPPTYTTCNCCCVTFVSLFINLRHLRDFMSHTSRRGTLYEYIKMCLFALRSSFSRPAAGLSSCSGLRGTQGARQDPTHKFGRWPRSVPRAPGIQSRRSPPRGIPSTWSLPAACKPTYRLNKLPTAHVVYGILNVINVVGQYLPRDGNVFPRHQQARHATTFNTIR